MLYEELLVYVFLLHVVPFLGSIGARSYDNTRRAAGVLLLLSSYLSYQSYVYLTRCRCATSVHPSFAEAAPVAACQRAEQGKKSSILSRFVRVILAQGPC